MVTCRTVYAFFVPRKIHIRVTQIYLWKGKNMNTKYHVNSILMTLALASVLALSAFAASESGDLGDRGSYSFSCTNGNIFSKYVDGSSSASYNGNTSTNSSNCRYVFTDGLARVKVTLEDGTNNENSEPFSGTNFSGSAYVKVYGKNDGSASCGARVSGVLLYDDETYSEANRIKVGTLFP